MCVHDARPDSESEGERYYRVKLTAFEGADKEADLGVCGKGCCEDVGVLGSEAVVVKIVHETACGTDIEAGGKCDGCSPARFEDKAVVVIGAGVCKCNDHAAGIIMPDEIVDGLDSAREVAGDETGTKQAE